MKRTNITLSVPEIWAEAMKRYCAMSRSEKSLSNMVVRLTTHHAKDRYYKTTHEEFPSQLLEAAK